MKTVKLVLVLVAILTYPWNVFAAGYTQDHTLNWDAPTTYVNGDALLFSDIAKFNVYQAGAAVVSAGTATSYKVTLGPGSYTYTVTAVVKSGAESVPSNAITIIVADDRLPGGCSLRSTRTR